MKLFNTLWSKLAAGSLILSLCIIPAISANVYAEELPPDIGITKTADPAQGASGPLAGDHRRRHLPGGKGRPVDRYPVGHSQGQRRDRATPLYCPEQPLLAEFFRRADSQSDGICTRQASTDRATSECTVSAWAASPSIAFRLASNLD